MNNVIDLLLNNWEMITGAVIAALGALEITLRKKRGAVPPSKLPGLALDKFIEDKK